MATLKRATSFHNHLNLQHSAIQFTMEEEKEERIIFLDIATSAEAE